jgi:hypothetical protein
MPSHSLNTAAYPPGHAATKDRPVPQANHLASIEKEANVSDAIKFVMTRDNIPYPAAAKLVHEKGEKFFLDQRDAVVNEIQAAQNKPPIATSPLRPGEEVIDVDATKVPKIVAKGK